jgi:hypothetical protein
MRLGEGFYALPAIIGGRLAEIVYFCALALEIRRQDTEERPFSLSHSNRDFVARPPEIR